MGALFPKPFQERKMSTRHAVSAGLLAAAALFAGASWAQLADGPRGPHAEGMGPVRGFERLHKQLNLNPKQEELWTKAQSAQRDAFKAMRAKGEETRARLRAEIDKPGVDLKQYAQLSDTLRDQMRAQMETTRKEVRAAWFGVYDSLDAKQREQVRVAIRDGMDRMARTGRHHRGGPRGEMGGEHLGQKPAEAGEG
jgi:Spy/CpxP family protein refolding chaperone